MTSYLKTLKIHDDRIFMHICLSCESRHLWLQKLLCPLIFRACHLFIGSSPYKYNRGALFFNFHFASTTSSSSSSRSPSPLRRCYSSAPGEPIQDCGALQPPPELSSASSPTSVTCVSSASHHTDLTRELLMSHV